MTPTPHAIDRPLPPPFAEVFGQDALCECAATLVALDPQGKILWTNAAWTRFAEENNGVDIAQRFGLGSHYCDGISGPLREYFAEAFTHVLDTRRPFELDYECSSPEVRRFMRLRALPIRKAGLLLEHSLINETPFADESIHEAGAIYVNRHGLISQCSNCRKVRRCDTHAWDWVPRWVRNPMPNVSHGICDVCFGFYWRR